MRQTCKECDKRSDVYKNVTRIFGMVQRYNSKQSNLADSIFFCKLMYSTFYSQQLIKCMLHCFYLSVWFSAKAIGRLWRSTVSTHAVGMPLNIFNTRQYITCIVQSVDHDFWLCAIGNVKITVWLWLWLWLGLLLFSVNKRK